MENNTENKNYYWLKLHKDFFTNPKMKKLRRIAGGEIYTMIYLKMMLLTLNTDGVIIYEGIEKTIEEELALKLDEDNMNIKVLLSFLQTQNLIEEISGNSYLLPQAAEAIGKESRWAPIKRKQRDKKAEIGHCPTVSKKCHIEKEIDNISPKERDIITVTGAETFSSSFKDKKSQFKQQLEFEAKIKNDLIELKNKVEVKIDGKSVDFYEVKGKKLLRENGKIVKNSDSLEILKRIFSLKDEILTAIRAAKNCEKDLVSRNGVILENVKYLISEKEEIVLLSDNYAPYEVKLENFISFLDGYNGKLAELGGAA